MCCTIQCTSVCVIHYNTRRSVLYNPIHIAQCASGTEYRPSDVNYKSSGITDHLVWITDHLVSQIIWFGLQIIWFGLQTIWLWLQTIWFWLQTIWFGLQTIRFGLQIFITGITDHLVLQIICYGFQITWYYRSSPMDYRSPGMARWTEQHSTAFP